jgi:hypothetical protein
MRRIYKSALVAVAAMFTALVLSSCGGGAGELLLGYYLYNQFINTGSSQKMVWSGTVTDGSGNALKGYTVEVQVKRPAPAADELRTGVTKDDGTYAIAVPYYQVAEYEIAVTFENITVYHDNLGPVLFQNQTYNLTVTSVAMATVSGTVEGLDGVPLAQAWVSVAKPMTVGGTPDTLIEKAEGGTASMMTNNTGVFYFENVFGSPLLSVAFNPDYGFGYYFIENPGAGSAGGTVVLPGVEPFTLHVRVLGNDSAPLVNTILPVDFRFKLKVTPAFNLSTQVADAVTEATLFGGITKAEIIALHPTAEDNDVASTGADGIADVTIQLVPGLYNIEVTALDGSAFSGVLVGQEQRILGNTAGETVEVRIPLV